ncbi:MAG: peptide-methionine (S)-S-oxide reductase [Proteobacteria bacterium]|nr:MAG: peptide-methionine (S)-S-oxide reductase [Pseudomonadota bacterium]
MRLTPNSELTLPSQRDALPGRAEAIAPPPAHAVSGHPMAPPWPQGAEVAIFGLGCFWGAERCFWQIEGVWSTQVGYAGGATPNPTYREVCTGMTGHNEVVRVVFDPAIISFADLCRVFFEAHDPTQGMRQGHDVGTQYRSGIYVTSEAQRQTASTALQRYAEALAAAGHRAEITTELRQAPPFYYAEEYHQQYLAKNPGGYCGLGGTGVCMPPW